MSTSPPGMRKLMNLVESAGAPSTAMLNESTGNLTGRFATSMNDGVKNYILIGPRMKSLNHQAVTIDEINQKPTTFVYYGYGDNDAISEEDVPPELVRKLREKAAAKLWPGFGTVDLAATGDKFWLLTTAGVPTEKSHCFAPTIEDAAKVFAAYLAKKNRMTNIVSITLKTPLGRGGRFLVQGTRGPVIEAEFEMGIHDHSREYTEANAEPY